MKGKTTNKGVLYANKGLECSKAGDKGKALSGVVPLYMKFVVPNSIDHRNDKGEGVGASGTHGEVFRRGEADWMGRRRSQLQLQCVEEQQARYHTGDSEKAATTTFKADRHNSW